MTEAEYEAYAKEYAKCEKFNVGDEVTVDRNLKITKIGLEVVREMLPYRGKTSIVKRKGITWPGQGYYILADFPWAWQDFMFELDIPQKPQKEEIERMLI